MVPGTGHYMPRTWKPEPYLTRRQTPVTNHGDSPESRPWRITTGEARVPWYWRHCRRVGLTGRKIPSAHGDTPVHRYRVTRLFSRNCCACARVVYVSVVVITCPRLSCCLCPPRESFVRLFLPITRQQQILNNIIVVIQQQPTGKPPTYTSASSWSPSPRIFAQNWWVLNREAGCPYSTRHIRIGIKLIWRPANGRNTIVVSLVVIVRPRQLLVSRVRALARRCVVSRPRDLAGSRFPISLPNTRRHRSV